MQQIREFLADIDREWRPLQAKQPLRIIGCSALMLQADYDRGTKDSDVLQTTDLPASASEQLVRLGGKKTALAERHRMYIDVVSNGLPFLPQRPDWHPVPALNQILRHFDVYVLDVVDVVVSKLKRYHANDQKDIEAMVDRNLVEHPALVSRFRAAMDCWQDGAHAEDLPKYIANLNAVERDLLVVEVSQFELPSWLHE